MKIAIVHEWLVDWAGSEKVMEQILACFPAADLYSLVDFLPHDLRAKILYKKVHTSFLQRMPFARKHLVKFLPFMPIAIEQLDLSQYDLVISNSHAVAKGVITGPDQIHISYVCSPMRYAWDLQHEYLRGSNGRGLHGFVLRWLLHYLRIWDSRTANGVDAFIADSGFVARRIEKVYRRQSTVIYPPVDIASFDLRETKENFYLCAGRLTSYKRIDLVVQAFAQMPDKRLVVLGDGAELLALKKISSSNVEFLGYQPNAVIRDYMQRARALIFPAKEDFGIVPVEAQACGTPVIAYNGGGATETVVALGEPNPTGILFDVQSAAAITASVVEFEENQQQLLPANCRRNAERFSNVRFREEFAAFVAQTISKHGLQPRKDAIGEDSAPQRQT